MNPLKKKPFLKYLKKFLVNKMNDNFEIIYEEMIFKHNLNVLCEEIESLTKGTIITEENILDFCKNIWNKITDFFTASINIFKKGYDAVIDFCKKFFQLSYIVPLLNKLGISDSLLKQLVLAVKSSLIVVPVVNIGYNVATKTYKDIHDNDVVILLDRAAFKENTEKIFDKKTFWEKALQIIKSGSKNLITELIASIPLIFKCVFGYAIASGFEQAIDDKTFLTDAQKKTIENADKLQNELGDATLTHEQALQKIGNAFSYEKGGAPTFDLLMRHIFMNNTVTYNKETGKWENVAGKHWNTTNHGQADIINGTRTRFDYNSGKYETEKLSDTEFIYEVKSQFNKYDTCDPMAEMI